MLIHQYIREFNELASNIKFLSVSDEVNLANKLKLIQTQFNDEEVPVQDIQDFFTNLYHLLCQANNIKLDLLENCLDILNAAMNSKNVKVRTIVCSDCRLLSVLISNLIQVKNDQEQVKILTIIQDLLSFGNELDEHNLKLTVEVLRDYSENSENKEVRSLCVNILINLCLTNDSARYIITRVFKATYLKDVVKSFNDDILSFKFLMLLEDELTVKDLKHFVRISLQSILASGNFEILPVKQSIAVLKHYEKNGVYSNTNISDDEKAMKELQMLNDSLISKLQSVDSSPEKIVFFEVIMKFYDMLLQLESGLVKELKSFIDVAFITSDVSKSANAIKLMASFIENGGVLESSELAVENLVSFFVEKKMTRLDYDKIFAFLSTLTPLNEKNLLNEQILAGIEEYFNDTIINLERADISVMEDEEIFHFVYFLNTLTCFAQNKPAFLVKLNKVLQMDSFSILYGRAYRSTKKDILVMLLQLSGTKNFPTQKVANILSQDIARNGSSAKNLQPNSSNIRRRESSSIAASRFMSRILTDEFTVLIERVNQKLDENEPVDSKDIAQLYRQKMRGLNDQLESVTSSLDNVSRQLTEHQHRILSFRSISEKQEFKLWCVQMDKDRVLKEVGVLNSQNALLKKSVEIFKAEAEHKEAEKQKVLNLKTVEIESKF